MCVIRPPADALLVGQMENRVSALTTAGSHGLRAAWMALEGEDPELLATPRAYSRGATARLDSAMPTAGRRAAGRRVGARWRGRQAL